jgi:hypothetical protein
MGINFKELAQSAKDAATSTAKTLSNTTNVLQGVLGNYSAINIEEAKKEFGSFLMPDEELTLAFKLIRDALIFTDKRLLLFDKQGVSGVKTRVVSIYLESVYSVTAETAGFAFDDSELTLSYISTPYLKGRNVEYAHKRFEFPKRFDVQSLYRLLQSIAYTNFKRINGMDGKEDSE